MMRCDYYVCDCAMMRDALHDSLQYRYYVFTVYYTRERTKDLHTESFSSRAAASGERRERHEHPRIETRKINEK